MEVWLKNGVREVVGGGVVDVWCEGGDGWCSIMEFRCGVARIKS